MPGLTGESIIFEVVEEMCIKDEVSQMDGSWMDKMLF